MHPSACVHLGKSPARFEQDVSFLLPSPDTISDDLRELPLECYDDAIEAILRVLAPHPDVLCVARFGTVKLPGVSDIDLLIVCRDEAYTELRRLCDQTILEIPYGSTLFVHQMMILPHSLLPLRRVLFFFEHLFDKPCVIWGDTTLLEKQAAPPLSLALINNIIWHSAGWRSVFAIRRNGGSLRQLLLLVRVVTVLAAVDYYFLRKEDRFCALQVWAENARQSCLLVPPPDRVRYVLEVLRRAFEYFLGAEWELQRWWRSCGCGEDRKGAWKPRMEGVQLLFAQERGKGISPSPPFPTFVLPSFYADVFGQLTGVFSGLSPLLPSTPPAGFPSLPTPWREAVAAYERAVLAAREFSQRVSGDPFFIFTGEKKRGIFPTPFAL